MMNGGTFVEPCFRMQPIMGHLETLKTFTSYTN